MAFVTKRAEILAEIAELSRLQLEASRQAVFGGWTAESEAAYESRKSRIAALRRELDVLE